MPPSWHRRRRRGEVILYRSAPGSRLLFSVAPRRHALPDDAAVLWVVIDATMSVTLARARADSGRGLSRDPEFHSAAHRRFRALLSAIPADRAFDSEELDAEEIAAAIAATIGVR